MAYSEFLADRIRQQLLDRKVDFEEKKMMGGLTFMVNTKMCVGIVKEELMARIGKEVYEKALETTGVRPMDFTGKPMRGYVFCGDEAIDTEEDLAHWVDLALAFNAQMVKS